MNHVLIIHSLHARAFRERNTFLPSRDSSDALAFARLRHPVAVSPRSSSDDSLPSLMRRESITFILSSRAFHRARSPARSAFLARHPSRRRNASIFSFIARNASSNFSKLSRVNSHCTRSTPTSSPSIDSLSIASSPRNAKDARATHASSRARASVVVDARVASLAMSFFHAIARSTNHSTSTRSLPIAEDALRQSSIGARAKASKSRVLGIGINSHGIN